MTRKARVGDGHDEFRDGLLEASQLLSKKTQASAPPKPRCSICEANSKLYRAPEGPCPHSGSQQPVAVLGPGAGFVVAPDKGEAIPELRVHQATPICTDTRRCYRCHLSIRVGETFAQVDIGRWGAPRLGELATLAFCLRCVKKEVASGQG